MHIHAPTVDTEKFNFQRLDFSEDFVLNNGGHYTFYISFLLRIFYV